MFVRIGTVKLLLDCCVLYCVLYNKILDKQGICASLCTHILYCSCHFYSANQSLTLYLTVSILGCGSESVKREWKINTIQSNSTLGKRMSKQKHKNEIDVKIKWTCFTFHCNHSICAENLLFRSHRRQ